jgi:hypothetical protein
LRNCQLAINDGINEVVKKFGCEHGCTLPYWMGEQTPREKCESDATSTKCEKEDDVHAETVG